MKVCNGSHARVEARNGSNARMEVWKLCENGSAQWNFLRWLVVVQRTYANVSGTFARSVFILRTLRTYEIISAWTNVL